MRIAALFKHRHLNLAPQRSPWFDALATPLALAAQPGELITARGLQRVLYFLRVSTVVRCGIGC
jgi:hypothetical protein